MDLIKELIYGNTKLRYMEVGFSADQADAMSWVAQQKAKGKFVGATSGLFLAFSWGHWHHRFLNHFRINFSKRFTQLGIIMTSILISDYIFTGRRSGANQWFANALLLNTNLLHANIDSLIQNFTVYPQKLSEEQIQAFNFRRKLLNTPHHKIENKKWMYNPYLNTPEQFYQKITAAAIGPWADDFKPANIRSLMDETGQKFGIPMKYTYGWRPLE